jgi:acetyltransferase-like isoleucine patch superfamily enzyme
MAIVDLIRRALGKGVRWALRPLARRFAVRGPNVTIMEPFSVNYPRRVFLGRDIYIGTQAAFNSAGGIRVGDGCVFGPFLHIYTANHRYEGADALPFDKSELLGPVDIAPNVWIAGDVVILPGVTIGEGAVVGGGSVVVSDVPAGAVVVGQPARQIKQRDMDRYAELKRSGSILNALATIGTFEPEAIGGVPASWYEQAGLAIPDDVPVVRGDA